jgi:hypothetical protein
MLPAIRNLMNRRGSEIVRVGIHAHIIAFDDGSTWSFSGKFSQPKIPKQSSLKDTGRRNMVSKLREESPYKLTISNYFPVGVPQTFCGIPRGKNFILANLRPFGIETQLPGDEVCPPGCFVDDGPGILHCYAGTTCNTEQIGSPDRILHPQLNVRLYHKTVMISGPLVATH